MATLSERIKTQNMENSNLGFEIERKKPVANIEIAEYPQSSLADKLKFEVAKKIATVPVWFEYSLEEQRDLVSSIFETLSQSAEFSGISESDFWLLLNDFKSQVRGLGALDFLLSMSDVSDILVSSQADVCLNGANGQRKSEFSFAGQHFSNLVESISTKSVSKSSVLEFKDFGLNMSLIREPVCKPKIFLSKTGGNYRTLSDLIEACVLTSKTSKLLLNSVKELNKIAIYSDENVCADYLFYSLLKEIKEPLILLQNSEFWGDLGDNVIKFNTRDISESEGNILIDSLFRCGVKHIFVDKVEDNILSKILHNAGENTGVVACVKNNPPKDNVNVLIHLTSKGLDYKIID